MSAVTIVVWTTAGFVLAVLAGLAQDEIKGRVLLLPYAVLGLARLLIPKDIRDDLCREWYAELVALMQDRTALPVTQLVVGLRFALGLLTGGRKAAVELRPLRTATAGSERTVRMLSLSFYSLVISVLSVVSAAASAAAVLIITQSSQTAFVTFLGVLAPLTVVSSVGIYHYRRRKIDRNNRT